MPIKAPTIEASTAEAPATQASSADRLAADGTQAIRRAAAILRVLAAAGPQGAAPSAIARSGGLARSTAHRMLRCLVEERLVEHADLGARYRLGPLVHELGLVPSSGAIEVARWRPAVEAVARRTGATAYLMRRSGLEAVCVVKADGDSMVRFVPVDTGQRRLLGVGAGATALLAALLPDRVDAVIRMITPGLAAYPRISPALLQQAVQQVRQTGFAVSRGAVVEDGFGMGAVIPATGSAEPHLAISLAAHASTVTDAAIADWKQVLAQEISAVRPAPTVAAPAPPACCRTG